MRRHFGLLVGIGTLLFDAEIWAEQYTNSTAWFGETRPSALLVRIDQTTPSSVYNRSDEDEFFYSVMNCITSKGYRILLDSEWFSNQITLLKAEKPSDAAHPATVENINALISCMERVVQAKRLDWAFFETYRQTYKRGFWAQNWNDAQISLAATPLDVPRLSIEAKWASMKYGPHVQAMNVAITMTCEQGGKMLFERSYSMTPWPEKASVYTVPYLPVTDRCRKDILSGL